MDEKKSSPEIAPQGMTKEDLQRLEELAEVKYRSIFQVVVSPDAVSNQHGDDL